MARAGLDRELAALRREVLALGLGAAAAVERAARALRAGDVALAQGVIAGNRRLAARRGRIEDHALWVIAAQQPVAGDLRRVVGALAVAGELARIGDYAKGLAKAARRLAAVPAPPLPAGLDALVARVLALLRGSLDAYAREDVAAAARLWREDDAVDALRAQLYAELFAAMGAWSGHIEPATRLLRAVHRLERIADRATNICERVAFIATGAAGAFRPRDP